MLIKIVNRLDKLENLHSEISEVKTNTINLAKEVNILSEDVNRLCSDYEQLDNKMAEYSLQMQKMLDPESGVYPKIFKIETSITSFAEKLNDDKINKKEKETERKKKENEQEELNEITKQLKIVGDGKELDKAKKAIDFHESFSKLMWIIIGGFTIQIVGIIITLLKK